MRKPPSNHSVIFILPQLAADETKILCYNQKQKKEQNAEDIIRKVAKKNKVDY